MMFYCLKCKKDRNIRAREWNTIGGKKLVYGICPVCKNVIKQKDGEEITR